ncbi:type IV toxin-antitoxin system AbiEi family antitoxin domain-containing protein [Arthrobacter sp. UM1]|uniref:type IV toxin-antitoxin system AbiEi family antitoxin domain-containing protein n=1 Tax=Arthrobacter sp. UM1 TaxID=2766776 RepID=UPI001CF6CF8C|nr:type IV toxin-antitoxin system AbiEi family antitoxin domain-containing protein [Arthrobacter sp. UM1]MCB4207420.1 type IV toxin-antitoxin system AbiEi family antitoxin domain-containing protein [Arthrobacter sp. UM1]
MRDREPESADLTKRITARKVLRTMAEDNYGVVTVAMAAEADIPAVEVRKLASRGALEALGQGVYLHKEVPQTLPETWLAAAVALCGPGAYLSGTAVMTLLGVGAFGRRPFDFMRNPVSVGTQRRVRRRLPEWISLERRTDIREESLVWIKGLPATRPVLALAEVERKVAPLAWFELVREVDAMGHLETGNPSEPDGPTDWNDAIMRIPLAEERLPGDDAELRG